MPTLPNEAPLIVTAHLAPASFDLLDALRRRHFPAALNRVPAHVSLFHHLPGFELRRVLDELREACRIRAPMTLAPSGVRLLGRGVAIAYEGGALAPLRAELAKQWKMWLTPQDKQPFKPHVTIQNKADSAAAKALAASLTDFDLPVCAIDGIAVWGYLGGPWAPVETCFFRAQ